MTELEALWHSPDGLNNAVAIRSAFPGAFRALEELDRLGHRQIDRAGGFTISNIDRLVGTALLRRSVTVFVGFRHLCEASVVEVAKLPLRALFEIFLAVRYLMHGGQRRVGFSTRSHPPRREARARYFYVAGERRYLYSQKALLDGKWGLSSALNHSLRARIRQEFEQALAKLERDFPTQMQRFGTMRCFRRRGRRGYHDRKQWFSFGFPKSTVDSVKALAARMGLTNEYELLYSATSGLMHPRGTRHDIKVTDDGAEVLHAYLPDALELVVSWSSIWQTSILHWLAQAYLPDSLTDVRETDMRVRAFTNDLSHHVPVAYF